MPNIYHINPEDQTPYCAAFVAAETWTDALNAYLKNIPEDDATKILCSYVESLATGEDSLVEIECLGQVCTIEANLRMEKWS